MAINYDEYSFEYKPDLQRIANKLRELNGVTTQLSTQDFTEFLDRLEPGYKFNASSLPIPSPIVVNDWSNMALEPKAYLTSYAEALKTRCTTNFGNAWLTVSQMAAMTEALVNSGEEDNSAIYVCQRITISDFYPTFSNFYIENYSPVPIEGCDHTDIAISDVEYFVGEIPHPNDPQITQYHLIVKYYVTIKNPYEGGEPYYIRIEATSDLGPESSDWAIISSNGELETENDNGEIGGGGEDPGPDLSTAVYATGYAGYMNGLDLKVEFFIDGNKIKSFNTYHSDDYSFSLNFNEGAYSYQGQIEYVYTGYYSEYGGESNYEYYLTGTFTSTNDSDLGKEVQIIVTYDYYNRNTVTFNIGTDMSYIERPPYRGDLSNPDPEPEDPVIPDIDNTTNYKYNVIPAGDSYGFSLNNNYYESTNQSIDDSYALCRVLIEVTETTDIVFGVINYAESNYDYGIIGNLNQELLRSNEDDDDQGNSVYHNFRGQQSNQEQIVTFSDVAPGSYFIEVKYRKDVSVSNNNDSIKFRLNGVFDPELN